MSSLDIELLESRLALLKALKDGNTDEDIDKLYTTEINKIIKKLSTTLNYD